MTSLFDTNPSLAKEWHPNKNASLTPEDVTPGSDKKVWWLCSKGHAWKATVKNRNKGAGCPYCSGKRVCIDNCLATVNPSLAKEWHFAKNAHLTPRDVTPGSHKKVWWRCRKGHAWKAVIYSRNQGRGCPYCSGRMASIDNCLATVNPSLAKEWHPTKNETLTPENVTPGSDKKVWWLCSKEHEWKAAIYSRNQGRGCPYCFLSSSELELRVYSEMKYVFDRVKHREKVYGNEIDIYIPEIGVGIEVDGLYWHKDKYASDIEKNVILNDKGITLLRVREGGLMRTSDYDVFFSSKTSDYHICSCVLRKLLKLVTVNDKLKHKIRDYFKGGKIQNNAEFKKFLEMLPSPLPGSSLEDFNEILAKEWHPTKNTPLTPRDVHPNSNKKVWWLCSKGHAWKATVDTRNKGAGCPYCCGKRVSIDNCLATLNPTLAKEWHPTKNETLTPENVTPGSHKKVRWRCSKGHEWEATVNSRNQGRGCPYCSGHMASIDNCLATLNPALAKEWHPTKNETLTPENVTPGSNKKVWWRCSKDHEWEAVIYNRNKGTGCPYCSGRKK